jgi:hypothetical protein
MARSNAPLALSVISLTEPGDVGQTLFNITQFDDRDFGFNHNRTWASMAPALTGRFVPEAVAKSFAQTPVRVQKCITALCDLGARSPLETKKFQDYPDAGLRTVTPIEWDPDIIVRVKATCWYVRNGQVVLPVLQPRKMSLTLERLAVYLRLVRQAYCKGDWVEALVEIIDLSGDEEVVTATPINQDDIPAVSDAMLARYVKTFIEAKREADQKRSERPKKPVDLPFDVLFENNK